VTCKGLVDKLGTSNETCHTDSLALVLRHNQLMKNMKIESDKKCDERIEPLMERVQTLTTANR